MSGRVGAEGLSNRFARLSALDLMFLRVESEAWPCHFGGLAVLDGGALVDPSGRLRLGEIVDRLSRRLAMLPQLRRRVLFPGPLRGRPLWVDDAGFDLQRHVFETEVEPPGGDGELLDKAAELCGSMLDRSRPLWELWFLTGLAEGRVGALLKLHHAVADGLAAVALMASLFDAGQGDREQGWTVWEPEPLPTGASLLVDGLSTKVRGIARAAAGLAHPISHAREFRLKAGVARRILSPARAPRTSLNRRVGAGRVVRFLCLDLTAVKDVAHGCGCKVNDVVLDVWTGGLRQLLVSRGEQVAQLEPVTTVPASLRSAKDAGAGGNELGAMSVPLPVWEPDVERRLSLIVSRTRQAKAEQQSVAVMNFLAALSRTPLGRYFAAHQHAANVEVTNVIGPPVPVRLFGAPVLAILPIVEPVGNMGPILCAFSYAGQLFLVVTADAHGFPDLEVLIAGMESDARALLTASTTRRPDGARKRLAN